MGTDETRLLHGFKQRINSRLLAKLKTIWVKPPEFSVTGGGFY
jgi:hypothetical protein